MLIEALLDDGATQDQRIQLADASVRTRPADALAVYLKAITPLTEQTGDKVYHQIAKLLLAARA